MMTAAIVLSVIAAAGTILSIVFLPEVKIKGKRIPVFFVVPVISAILIVALNVLTFREAWDGLTGDMASMFHGRNSVNPVKILLLFFGMTTVSVFLDEAERTLCTGVHKNCRLHFTKGEPPKRPPCPEAAWDAESFRKQRAKNREYYKAHLVENRLAIQRLTQKLRNTLLLQEGDEGDSGRAGRLMPEKAWRAAALDDERVFSRAVPHDPGELSVDILLDGSASQNRQQEKLSTQAYLLVESLTRCHIPVRVTAFCSVSGCTVLRILRDYGHPEQNEGVLDYVAAGWNRDGLALRAMGWLMGRQRSERRLLLVLSDASPNDDQRIPNGWGGYAYTGKRGVDDSAAEAGQLRLHGVTPVCLFTGSDREADDARRIYGKAVEKLPAIGWFADVVGRLIEGEIRAKDA